MTSVVATPVAAVVTTVAHAADAIALVPSAEVPDAIKIDGAPAEPVLTPSAVMMPVPVVTVDGATPAPPPTTIAFAASAAEDAHVDAELKYGMPPEVPAMVKAGVVVGVPTETMPPVHPTEVTVPPPAEATHDVTPEPFVCRT